MYTIVMYVRSFPLIKDGTEWESCVTSVWDLRRWKGA